MPNNRIQSLTVNGTTYDIVDNTSGYINAQYIENKTDYEIPVSRVGEIVVGETAIGTDSTNFPTSKAVVDYVDERVVQEIDAISIDPGVTEIKANGVSLPINNGVVNIPGFNLYTGQAGLFTLEAMNNFGEYVESVRDDIPTSTSQLTNDSGYLTSSDIASVLKYKGTKANYAALPSSGNTTGDVWHLTDTGAEWAWDGSAWQELGTAIDLSNYATKATTLAGYGITDAKIENGTITLGSNTITPLTSFTETDPTVPSWAKQSTKPTYTASEVGALPDTTTIPTKTSDLTNDSGFITSYTDEKVKTDLIPSTSATYYLTLSSSGSSQTNTLLKASELSVYYTSNSMMKLILGKSNVSGMIRLYGGSSYYIDLGVVGSLSANRSITLPNKDGTIALTSDIPDTSSFLTSETDPVFSASAAAGITSTDISNWNAKVSDTGKWNNIALDKTANYGGADVYVPYINSTSATTAYLVRMRDTVSARTIAVRTADSYLVAATPPTNDNSTRVATTAYVDAAIPDTSSFLTLATLPIYDGTVV